MDEVIEVPSRLTQHMNDVLCALYTRVEVETTLGQMHLHNVAWTGVSYLLFANDTIIFCGADLAQTSTIRELFVQYEVASGQKCEFL